MQPKQKKTPNYLTNTKKMTEKHRDSKKLFAHVDRRAHDHRKHITMISSSEQSRITYSKATRAPHHRSDFLLTTSFYLTRTPI